MRSPPHGSASTRSRNPPDLHGPSQRSRKENPGARGTPGHPARQPGRCHTPALKPGPRTRAASRSAPAINPDERSGLVRHDYGMGALWWWITAASAAAITTTFAEVEVIDDPTTVRAVESWSLDELDIADAISGPLAELYSKRKQQCQNPPLGKLLGKSRAYLRLTDADGDL